MDANPLTQIASNHSVLRSTDQGHFRLLDLPQELVSIICAYVVTLPGPICLHTIRPINSEAEKLARSKFVEPAQRTITEPPIALVNRQLRAEALPLYYRLNDFHEMHSSIFWLKRIRQSNRGVMDGVFISYNWTVEELARYSVQMGLGEAVKVEVAERGVIVRRLCVEAHGEHVIVMRLKLGR